MFAKTDYCFSIVMAIFTGIVLLWAGNAFHWWRVYGSGIVTAKQLNPEHVILGICRDSNDHFVENDKFVGDDWTITVKLNVSWWPLPVSREVSVSREVYEAVNVGDEFDYIAHVQRRDPRFYRREVGRSS